MSRAKAFTFPKQERLCGERTISELFSSGRSEFAHPFRLVWKWADRTQLHPIPMRVLIVVPKRQWKRAVDRNRMKRLVREAYRTTKPSRPLHRVPEDKTLLMAFIWVAKKEAALAEIQEWMMKKLPSMLWPGETDSSPQSSAEG